MHPLAPDLSGMTDEELHTKRSELMSRLGQAYRFGSYDLVAQLQLLLGDYAIEVERRNKQMLDQAQKSGRLGTDSDNPAKDITL